MSVLDKARSILRIGFLRNTLLVAVVVAVVFPAYQKTFIYPRFIQLLISSTEDEAKRTASHFSTLLEAEKPLPTIESLLPSQKLETLLPTMEKVASKVVRDFNLIKLKVFTKSGKTIYSTDPKDIGVMNERDYFHNLVAKGQTFTKVVLKQQKSLEGEIYSFDIVETYAPIMDGGDFIGAYEIYYDITEKKRALDNLLRFSSMSLLIMAICFVLVVVIIVVRASGDIEAREEAQRQLLKKEKALKQAQKSAALGNLAGGVAHEFNNMLVPIMGLTELTLDDLPENSQAQRNLQMVMETLERARHLIKQVQSFERVRDDHSMDKVVLEATVREATDILRSTLPSTIKLDVDLNTGNVKVLCDPKDIHQVIMNLGANAADAMEGERGNLDISLELVEIKATDGAGDQGLESGAFAKLTLHDDGMGMGQETKEKVFDPFFTTKEVGEGTGLGLFMVHGIITACGGTIRVDSELGAGTTFEIFIPILSESK